MHQTTHSIDLNNREKEAVFEKQHVLFVLFDVLLPCFTFLSFYLDEIL